MYNDAIECRFLSNQLSTRSYLERLFFHFSFITFEMRNEHFVKLFDIF